MFAMGTVPASLASELTGYPVATGQASAGSNGAIVDGTAVIPGLGSATVGASAGPDGADITAAANIGGQVETFAASFGVGWTGTATAMESGGATAGPIIAQGLANEATPGIHTSRVVTGVAAGIALGVVLIAI